MLRGNYITTTKGTTKKKKSSFSHSSASALFNLLTWLPVLLALKGEFKKKRRFENLLRTWAARRPMGAA